MKLTMSMFASSEDYQRAMKEQQMHAMQAEHQRERQLRQQQKADASQFVQALVDAHGLRFVHVRSDPDWNISNHKGGVTVAYTKRGHRTIDVACALVHEKDSYNKSIGRFVAAKNYERGDTITLRVPKNMPTAAFIKTMFGTMVE